MAFFDYNRDGKKDWKDNAREYYLYNKFQRIITKVVNNNVQQNSIKRDTGRIQKSFCAVTVA